MQKRYVVDTVSLVPFNPTYSFINPPSADRCNAIAGICAHPECDFVFDSNDQETPTCPVCSTPRKLCAGYPVKGRTRCAAHGGNALRGVSNPNYKGASISKHLPTELLEFWKATEGKTDAQLLDMSDNIRLMEARRFDLMNRSKEKEPTPQMWKRILDEFKKYDNIMSRARHLRGQAKDRALGEARDSLNEIRKIATEGYHKDYEIWREIDRLDEKHNKLARTEITRRKIIAEMVTEEQVKTLIGRIMWLIEDTVTDRKERSKLITKIQKSM